MDKAKFTLKYIHHRGAERLAVFFEPDRQAQAVLKRIGARYSRTHRCWHVLRDKTALHRVFKVLQPLGYVDYSKVKKQPEPETGATAAQETVKDPFGRAPGLPHEIWRKLHVKGYSDSTVRNYGAHLQVFIHYCDFHCIRPEDMETEDLEEFLSQWMKARQPGNSTSHGMVNALKFYYEKVHGRSRKFLEVERPKREKKLPRTISREQIAQLLHYVQYPKHRCAISLLYSTGMRVGELLRLRLSDIDWEGERILVYGKGNKERYVFLAEEMKTMLQEYLAKFKPREYVIEGQQPGQPYTRSSIGQVLKSAAEALGIEIAVTPHVLRHSFASHLLQSGVDIRQIQHLLGHNSIKTTQIYTHLNHDHLRQITSPLDQLVKDNKLNFNNINKKP